MALIPVVGRRSAKMRSLILLLYFVLSLGAVTTVYPFLIMIGESLTSDYDKTQFPIVPDYLIKMPALFGKYANDKFGGDIELTNAAYRTSFATSQDVLPPSAQLTTPQRVSDWQAFFQSLPLKYKSAGFKGIPGVAYTPAPLTDRYQDFLEKRYHGNIRALDKAYTEEDADFSTVLPPFEDPRKHNWLPGTSLKTQEWEQFEQTLPLDYFQAISGDAIFQKWLNEDAYNGKIADLNAAWKTNYANLNQVTLTATPAGNAAERADWETFVRTISPIQYTVVSPSALPAYRQFIAGRYHTVEAYNKVYQTHAASFADLALPVPDSMNSDGVPLLDYVDFLKSAAPLASLSVDTMETRYRAHLVDQYHLSSLEASTQVPPIYMSDWQYVQAHSGQLRRTFAARNYGLIIHYLLVHGDAIRTTVIFCFLAVLTALIVNPLCAYALSRYNLPYATGVLLFLLATMSFPGEVTQIPNFLLLKQLGMLNTFYALVLPTVANGYSIFLLKGFFDSLPKELYEAGTIDGATEMRMFWAITLPLSKPIFAVIGLSAFTVAYGQFLFAMLTCQDPKMWTIMVWMYQLQSNSAPTYTMLAGLTLASLPTLLVFVFAQNTIMKGIILPSYK